MKTPEPFILVTLTLYYINIQYLWIPFIFLYYMVKSLIIFIPAVLFNPIWNTGNKKYLTTSKNLICDRSN